MWCIPSGPMAATMAVGWAPQKTRTQVRRRRGIRESGCSKVGYRRLLRVGASYSPVVSYHLTRRQPRATLLADSLVPSYSPVLFHQLPAGPSSRCRWGEATDEPSRFCFCLGRVALARSGYSPVVSYHQNYTRRYCSTNCPRALRAGVGGARLLTSLPGLASSWGARAGALGILAGSLVPPYSPVVSYHLTRR